MGVDYTDLIVLRSIEKGTKTISESGKKSNWAGQSFKDSEKSRLKPFGDVVVTSSKGTQKIHLGQMSETKIANLDGRHLITGRGTGIRIA